MVMVDELRIWPTNIRCFKSGSCHLTASGWTSSRMKPVSTREGRI